MPSNPWPHFPIIYENFRQPPREYGILPFWFLNGELDPEEMRYQLQEYRKKGMPGIILHARYGLEMPYLGNDYLDRIRLAVEEAERLGLETWLYDEMNWPSGTADKQVLKARPDLAQRYLECINFSVRGPWFTYLTGADSRYLDFERSTPVAAFATGESGQVIDLTPYLSFRDIIPWEAPAGNWRLLYIVEKTADYYIDALNPEATREFLRLGYQPYADAVGQAFPKQVPGFYTDEPAMHYYLTGGDNPIVPWTKDMFRRFKERNGYNLRPYLPDLFFDVSPDGARARYDFYTTLTEFYSQAYYQQIHAWCQEHDVLFTGHLLYEEWLRKLVRVEGNLFKHYPHFDVVGVDHLYPVIGNRDRPDDHVALKIASSAAHQTKSPRVLCESYGGIFMDTTLQRMKWIADWEHVLGVNLVNPHGFHYTIEGPRKRDWPPSQFYQYPWWEYYGEFSKYISRLGQMLSGGKHVAKVAVLWPINSLFASYSPQNHDPLSDRTEQDFNALTDLLLRLHYDFDYLDEDVLASAQQSGKTLVVGDEAYELVIVPPMQYLKLATIDSLEAFVKRGGKLLGSVFLPNQAITSRDGQTCLVDISTRVQALFGIDPVQSQATYQDAIAPNEVIQEFPNGGKALFLKTYAIARRMPMRLQVQLGKPGWPENTGFIIQEDHGSPQYFFAPNGREQQEITSEVIVEREAITNIFQSALEKLIDADVRIDNPEVFYLHRQKDGEDIYFLINPTFVPQTTQVGLTGEVQPVSWDPSTGKETIITPSRVVSGLTTFSVRLPPAGSIFILPKACPKYRIVNTNLMIDTVEERPGSIQGYARANEAFVSLEKEGREIRLTSQNETLTTPLQLGGDWEFQTETDNALVIKAWLAQQETPGTDWADYAQFGVSTDDWLPMVQGAWSYQLPAEPEANYPIPVWYRATFQIEDIPSQLNLIVDGFAGKEWQLFVNGITVESIPIRSSYDSQMKAVDISASLRKGENLIALRLVVASPTDGLLDLLKLVGSFALAPSGNHTYRMIAPCLSLAPHSWAEQGYPYYSGRVVYRKRFSLPETFIGQRIWLEIPVHSDVLEVIVNGQSTEICLWEPYRVDVTPWLQSSENVIELRLANTLINLIEGVERPSGLAGSPELVPYPQFRIELPE